MAIAVGLPAEGEALDAALEGVTMIFGMKDAAAAKKAMEEAFEKQMADVPEKYRPKPEERPTFTVSGSYLTMSRGPAGARGGARIAATAPEGDVGLRVDLGAIVARYRSDIDKGMAEMEKGMSQGMGNLPPSAASFGNMFKGLAEGIKDLVNSAETLDVGVSVDGGHVELAVGFVAKEGSKLDKQGHDHAGLASMAAHLPQGMPLNLLMSIDMGSMMTWLKPLMEAGMEQMPEADKAKFKAYIDETMEMSKLLGPNMAASVSLGDKGIELVEIVECKDAATYIARVDKLFASDVLAAIPGFGGKKTGTTKVAGVDVHSYALTLDMQKMMEGQGAGKELPPEMLEKMSGMMQQLFGEDGITFHMAAVDNLMVVTMGGTDRLAAGIESIRKGDAKAPAALQAGLDRAGGTPTFLMQMDVRALARQIMGMVRGMMDKELPEVPAGAPIPVLVWGKHDGRVYGGGLKVDVGGIVDMAKAMDGK